MKTFRVILMLALLVVGAVSAQQKGFSEFGVGTGINFSAGTDGKKDPLIGWNIGVFGDYYFNEKWSVRAKLSYDQKGWANMTTYTGGAIWRHKEDINVDYVTISLMAGRHFLRQKQAFIYAGPYFGRLTKDRYGINWIDLNYNDAGAAYAAGMKFKIGKSQKRQLFLEFQGQWGFIDVIKKIYSYDENITNVCHSLNLGVIF